MRVTVILSVYNQEEYLGEAIESVLNQTHPDFEFFIIDDGSTDRSPEIIAQYARQDSRIRVFTHENWGVPKSVNAVVPESQCQWLVRMDSDDIMLPGLLEEQLLFIKNHPDVKIAGCTQYYINTNGNIISASTHRLFTVTDFQRHFQKKEPIGILNPGSFIHKDTFLELGGYRDYIPGQDTDFWNRAALAGHLILVNPKYLIKYRIHSQQVTQVHLKQSILNWKWNEIRFQGELDKQPYLSREAFFKKYAHLTFWRMYLIGPPILCSYHYKKALLYYSDKRIFSASQHALQSFLYNPLQFCHFFIRHLQTRFIR